MGVEPVKSPLTHTLLQERWEEICIEYLFESVLITCIYSLLSHNYHVHVCVCRWWRNWSVGWPWRTAGTCLLCLSTVGVCIVLLRAESSLLMCWPSLSGKRTHTHTNTSNYLHYITQWWFNVLYHVMLYNPFWIVCVCACVLYRLALSEPESKWKLYFKLYCFLDVESTHKDGVEFVFMFEQVSGAV